jgi:hypothetical protein
MYTFNEFVITYNVNINFVEYYGIISAFPKNWKQINLVDAIILDRICNEIVEKRKAEKNLVNIFTDYLFRESSKNMFIVMIKWENDLEISVGDWYAICSLTFCITKNTKLQNRQFKLLHIILPCNSFLYQYELKTALCTFCMETKENLLHLFWNVNLAQNYWFAFKNFLMICGIALRLNARELALGISENYIKSYLVNFKMQYV